MNLIDTSSVNRHQLEPGTGSIRYFPILTHFEFADVFGIRPNYSTVCKLTPSPGYLFQNATTVLLKLTLSPVSLFLNANVVLSKPTNTVLCRPPAVPSSELLVNRSGEMVAPVNGPSLLNSTEGSNIEASRSEEKRRQEILQKLLLDAVQLRRQGNTLFKDRLYGEAVETYSNAIHVLRKVRIGPYG